MTLFMHVQHVTCTACGFGTSVASDGDLVMTDWMCPRCQFQLCPRCGSVDREVRRMMMAREADLEFMDDPWEREVPCRDAWHGHRPITVAHEIPRELLKLPQPRPLPDFDRVMGISDAQLWLLSAVLLVLVTATAISAASILFSPLG